jgi:two-component system, LuxR family, sensor kinase FixL
MTTKEFNTLKSAAGFEALIQHATIGILSVGQSGIIEMANPYAEKLFGYDAGEMTGMSHDILIPEDIRKQHADYAGNYFVRPVDRPMGLGRKLKACRKDGSQFHAEISLAYYEHNGEKMAVAFISDISERQRIEDQLQVNEQNIRLLIEHTPAAIAMFDRDMRYIIASRRWLEDYRLTGKNIIGLSHYEVFPEISQEWKNMHRRCLAGEVIHCDEDTFPRADGNIDWVQWELCPWYTINKEIGGIIIFTEVITERKRAKEQLINYAASLEKSVEERTQSLRKTVQELEQAKGVLSQSLEKERELGQLKSRFVSMASHEFRTPLSAIQLSASLIERYAQPFENEHIAKHIQKIKKATANLTSILDDFLSLEKLEAGRVQAVYGNFDLIKFSEEIAEEMQMIAKQDQHITYQHTGNQHLAHLDPNLLRSCIINLITNAIKYSGEHTFIEFNTEINDENCVITVKDNGIGIPENDQKYLFDPFFRAHNTGSIQGTGLGLNIVARYAKLMNGEVGFKSKVNQGAIFTLVFPMAG